VRSFVHSIHIVFFLQSLIITPMKTLKISNLVLFWYFAVLAALNVVGVVLLSLAQFFPQQITPMVSWLVHNSFFGFVLNFSANTPLVISALLAFIYSLLFILEKKSFNLFSLSLSFGLVGAITAWVVAFMSIQNLWTAIIMITLLFGSYVTAIVTGLIVVYKETKASQSLIENRGVAVCLAKLFKKVTSKLKRKA
jgi:hypothetical protein